MSADERDPTADDGIEVPPERLDDDGELLPDDEPPHLEQGSPHTDEPAPYEPPNPNVP